MKRTLFAVGLAALCLMWAAASPAQVPDHLKCYKVKDALKLSGTLDLTSPQFGLEAGCKVSSTALFCVPASKSNVSVTDKATRQPLTPLPFSAAPAGDDRVCYKIKCPKPATPIPNQSVTDQFGNRTLTGFTASLLCTPAVKGAAFCGNGVLDPGEECDGANLGGATCETAGFAKGTLACAPGCTFDTTACVRSTVPGCGNGMKEGTEECDGADLGGATCGSLGFNNGGTLACTAGCGFDTSGCACAPASTCGDSKRDGTEQCDLSDLGGATCQSLGYLQGTLACTASCTFDTTGCSCSTGECSPAVLPATGQTTCWASNGSVIACAGTGQDGDLRKGAPLVYMDNGDGTVTDVNTTLVWEKQSQDGTVHDLNNLYSWADAFAVHVATLNSTSFAGHNDWRVPNERELLSILDYAYFAPSVSPAFNNHCSSGCTVTTCSCTAIECWSSTSQIGGSSAYVVHVNSAGAYFSGKSNGSCVRAVRGGS